MRLETASDSARSKEKQHLVASPNTSPGNQSGFILIFTLLLVLAITAIGTGMLVNARMNKSGGLNNKNQLQSFYASDGMVTLISQEILDGRDSIYMANLGGKIAGKVWKSYFGPFDAAGMKAYAENHSTPSYTDSSDFLGSNWNFTAYLVQWRGYILPPVSGNFKFFVRTDDYGAFYLSSDEDPKNLSKDPICKLTSWTYSWPTSGSGVSIPQYLEAGRRYYFEFYHAQGNGGDHGDVGWEGPDWIVQKPILKDNIAAFGSKPAFEGITALGRRSVKYSVTRAGDKIFGVSAEAVRVLGQDSGYRQRLSRLLSLKSINVAPPENMNLPVIYYDFHSDGRNPEFENPWPSFTPPGNWALAGMVTPTLTYFTTTDAGYFGLSRIGKPLPSGTPFGNCGVARWFVDNDPTITKVPRYLAANPADCALIDVGPNTRYENMKFKDSLTFTRDPSLGPNTYVFSRQGGSEPEFFPLEGRGFGKETLWRNFSFCMEMHNTFMMSSGLTFKFNGDDDLWVYINNQLVMDLGATHQPVSASIKLDDLPLKYGEQYSFDLFYCERHTHKSTIRIETNLPIQRQSASPQASWKRESFLN